MKKLLRDYFRLLRPRQWIKNFAIFAAILFSGYLFNTRYLNITFYGFLIFCALSSAIYVINDIFDVEKDKLHPFKRFRPLAKGDIPVSAAMVLAFIFADFVTGVQFSMEIKNIYITYFFISAGHSEALHCSTGQFLLY